jgi:hypothetical protein
MSSSRFCPQCGKQNPDSNTFCGGCGSSLYPQPAAPTPLPPPPPSSQAQPTAEERAAQWGWDKRSSTNQSTKGCLIAAGVVLGLLVLCGIIGSLSDKNKTSSTSQSSSSPQGSGTETPTPTPSPSSPAEALTRAKQLTGTDASRDELGQAVDLLSGIQKGAKEYKEAQSLLEPTRKRWARLAAEAIVLGPKPENSGWGGKVYCVDHYLKRTLNDYDSAEYLEWSPVARMDVKGEPYWAVRLKLRAKNAFGALIVKDVVFLIRQNEVVNVIGL